MNNRLLVPNYGQLRERDGNKEKSGAGPRRSNEECGRLEGDRDGRRTRHKEPERLILGDRTVSKTDGGRERSHVRACLRAQQPCAPRAPGSRSRQPGAGRA